MTASDNLAKLSERAKQAEEKAAKAAGQARADLETTVNESRVSAQAQADKLRANVEASKDEVSAWWNDVQTSWGAHVEKVRASIDAKKEAHDVKQAERRADNAESDALIAIDYAYATLEEAEYAVLDAILARAEADEAAAGETT